MRQYDILNPHKQNLPVKFGWAQYLEGSKVNGLDIAGGPQMFQLSLDGKRLYVTTSLFSTWDNQFYPDIREKGGVMVMIDCDPVNGGMKINPDFIVNFGKNQMVQVAVTKVDILVAIALAIYGCEKISSRIIQQRRYII